MKQRNDTPQPKLPAIKTPLIHIGEVGRGVDLWVKDERQCPTGTFKDRLAWRLAQEIEAGRLPSSPDLLISCITLGNTLSSVAYALTVGLQRSLQPQLFGVFPAGFSQRTVGPDTHGRKMIGRLALEGLRARGATCLEYPLDQNLLTPKDIAKLARREGLRFSAHRDITSGIGVAAYRPIIAEALDAMDSAPDWIVVPVGAGVLFKECVEEVRSRELATHVLGITVIDPRSVADKLYGIFSPYYDELMRSKVAYHESDYRYAVVPVDETRLLAYLRTPLPFDSEPSGWAAFVPVLTQATPFPGPKGRVLAVHTGNGIPFAVDNTLRQDQEVRRTSQ